MALPTLTSNSPVGGSIAWTAFGIQYAGTSYSIAAGNSANKYVWWEHATNTVKSANTLPTLTDNDMLLFLNKNGVGALVPMTDVLDGSLIVPQSILANAIAADQIDATHIKAGSIGADEIVAGAVTTEKLTVGSVGDNLVTNGSFEEFTNGVPLGWSASVEAGTGSSDVVSGVSSSGAYAARLIIPNTTSGARLSQIDSKVIPVSSVSARSWYVSARVGASVAITKGFYLQVRWLDANKALISTADVVTNTALTTSWEVKEGRVTPPSAARYMRVTVMCTLPDVAANVYIDEVSAREVVVAAQIGDNAITAAHIKADAIDGKTIRGVTVIGAEVKTTDTAGAISARMGPTAAYHFDGSVTFPGIGFVTEGAVGQRHAGMYSETGPDLTLTQGGDLAYADNQAYVQLKDDAVKLYSRQPVSITGRNGVNIDSQVGPLNITGNSVTISGPLQLGGNYQLAPVADDTARNNMAATDGSTVVRTDQYGAHQHKRSGRWDLFSGSVAYATIVNGYKNYGNGYATTHAYFEGERVHLGGMIGVVNSTITASAGAVYTFGTIPLEYAPIADEIFRPAHGPNLDARVNIYVKANGDIQWYNPTALNSVSTGAVWWSLAGISYRRRPW